MLYNNDYNPDHSNPTDTNIFGTNILLTLDVNIIGKEAYMHHYRPFQSLADLINAKNRMAPPRNGQPIRIDASNPSCIRISCRLEKNGRMAHDPNIGTAACISAGIRKLGYQGDIVITNHQISQGMLNATSGNKFLYICSILGISLDGLTMPTIKIPNSYWRLERESEKIASIYLQILAEKYRLEPVFQNHAGCERGYFISDKGYAVPVPKNISIPDLVVSRVINNCMMYTIIEGKTLSTIFDGAKQLASYDAFENAFLKNPQYGYPDCLTLRNLTIFGGKCKGILHNKVLLYINEFGSIYPHPDAPSPWREIFLNENLY